MSALVGLNATADHGLGGILTSRQIGQAYFMSFLCVAGAAANIVVMCRLPRASARVSSTSTHFRFLKNLFTADLLMCLLNAPMFLMTAITGLLVRTSVVCAIQSVTALLFAAASIVLLVCLSFDRYSTIVRKAPLTVPQSYAILAVAWFLAIMIGFGVLIPGIPYGVSTSGMFCSSLWWGGPDATSPSNMWNIVHPLTSFVTLLSVMCMISVHYYRIYQSVQKSRDNLTRLTATQFRNNNKHAKMAFNMFLLVLVFVADWALYLIVILAQMTSRRPFTGNWIFIDDIGTTMGFANSVVNPIVYMYVNREQLRRGDDSRIQMRAELARRKHLRGTMPGAEMPQALVLHQMERGQFMHRVRRGTFNTQSVSGGGGEKNATGGAPASQLFVSGGTIAGVNDAEGKISPVLAPLQQQQQPQTVYLRRRVLSDQTGQMLGAASFSQQQQQQDQQRQQKNVGLPGHVATRHPMVPQNNVSSDDEDNHLNSTQELQAQKTMYDRYNEYQKQLEKRRLANARAARGVAGAHQHPIAEHKVTIRQLYDPFAADNKHGSSNNNRSMTDSPPLVRREQQHQTTRFVMVPQVIHVHHYPTSPPSSAGTAGADAGAGRATVGASGSAPTRTTVRFPKTIPDVPKLALPGTPQPQAAATPPATPAPSPFVPTTSSSIVPAVLRAAKSTSSYYDVSSYSPEHTSILILSESAESKSKSRSINTKSRLRIGRPTLGDVPGGPAYGSGGGGGGGGQNHSSGNNHSGLSSSSNGSTPSSQKQTRRHRTTRSLSHPDLFLHQEHKSLSNHRRQHHRHQATLSASNTSSRRRHAGGTVSVQPLSAAETKAAVRKQRHRPVTFRTPQVADGKTDATAGAGATRTSSRSSSGSLPSSHVLLHHVAVGDSPISEPRTLSVSDPSRQRFQQHQLGVPERLFPRSMTVHVGQGLVSTNASIIHQSIPESPPIVHDAAYEQHLPVV
jgi:hypothetical protein